MLVSKPTETVYIINSLQAVGPLSWRWEEDIKNAEERCIIFRWLTSLSHSFSLCGCARARECGGLFVGKKQSRMLTFFTLDEERFF